jgi:hypothetical protein
VALPAQFREGVATMSGAIHGREVDAVTINADEGVVVYVMEGGHKFCVPTRRGITLRGNPIIHVPCACAMKVPARRTAFQIPADRGCR